MAGRKRRRLGAKCAAFIRRGPPLHGVSSHHLRRATVVHASMSGVSTVISSLLNDRSTRMRISLHRIRIRDVFVSCWIRVFLFLMDQSVFWISYCSLLTRSVLCRSRKDAVCGSLWKKEVTLCGTGALFAYLHTGVWRRSPNP